MRLLLTFAFLLILAINGQAQNSIKKEKIKVLFASMHQDSLVIKNIDAMTASMVKNMAKILNDSTYSNLGINANALTDQLMSNSLKKSKENALEILNHEMVDIYDKYFTTEEIDDFSKFYNSTSGQKLLGQMTVITKDVMTIMTTKYQADFQQTLMKDIQTILEKAKSTQQ